MRTGRSGEQTSFLLAASENRALHLRIFAAVLVGVAALSPLSAAPVDAVRMRVAGFRDLGASFKSLNDALRRGDANPAAMAQATRRIRELSRAQYAWFPKGSGPASGTKTAARPEIWTDPAKFKSAQDAFAAQALALDTAASSADKTNIQSQARRLGATCKACHDSFRNED
ncbi:cytochrome c [Novosphingobium sp. BL-8H]|uniref:c-type cytochrome n=1 Tax=Novosphingobium sp. BL-8H TaxID=3127640 RepID=UPI00375664EA